MKRHEMKEDFVSRLKAINNNVVNEHGLTPKEERMAVLVSKGKPMVEAFATAFGVEGALNANHYETAMELMAREKMQARLHALGEQAVEAISFNSDAIRKHVLTGLIKESKNEKASATARVQALVWLGKVDTVGMFRERTEVMAADNRKPEEIEVELREKLRKMLMKAAK